MKPALLATLAVLSAAWIYRDARRQGLPHAGGWAAGSLVFWLPVLLAYLWYRRRFRAAGLRLRDRHNPGA